MVLNSLLKLKSELTLYILRQWVLKSDGTLTLRKSFFKIEKGQKKSFNCLMKGSFGNHQPIVIIAGTFMFKSEDKISNEILRAVLQYNNTKTLL